MYSTLSSGHPSLFPLLSSAPQNPFLKTPSFATTHGRRRFRTSLSFNPLHKPKTLICNAGKIGNFPEFSRSSNVSCHSKIGKEPSGYNADNVFDEITKPVVFILFWFVIGCCSYGGFLKPTVAVAAPVASEVVQKSRKLKSREQKPISEGKEKDAVLEYEYSDYTRRLLETVSGLLRSIKEVDSGDGDVDNVEAALKKVKSKKQELQDEMLRKFEEELDVCSEELDVLTRESDKIIKKVMGAKEENASLVGENVKEQTMKLEEEMSAGEKEYTEIMERIDEIEDKMSRKEAMVFNIAVRELSFIERECKLLVESFTKRLGQKNFDGVSKAL